MSAELEGTLSTRATLEGEISIGNGTKNYNDLRNKPSINDVELEGNKTSSELGFADVATSGSYDDLTDKPTIPAAQVNADWNSEGGVSEILNKPDLAKVATSGNYEDLNNTPSIPAPQVQADWNEDDDSKADFIKNKPSIPSAQVNSDWNAVEGVAKILNKPTIPTKTSELDNDSGYTSSTVIANPYDETSTYAVGEYVTHENNLYKCNTAITTAEEWNAEHWTLVDVISAIPTKTSDLDNDSGFITGDNYYDKSEIDTITNSLTEFPSDLYWSENALKGKLYRTFEGIRTDFDVSSLKPENGKTYYIKPSGSDSNTGLDKEHPLQKLATAIAKPDVQTIIVMDGIYNIGRIGGAFTKGLNIIADENAHPIFIMSRDKSWSATAGRTNVYETTDSASTYYAVIKLDATDEYGDYLHYTKVASLDDVESTENSWYSSGNTIYVHSESTPTKTYVIVGGVNLHATLSNGETIYIEGCEFIGGNYGGVRVTNGGTVRPTVLLKNCGFSDSPLGNSLYLQGCKGIIQNCYASHGSADGFNYHSVNLCTPETIEINCIGRNNGTIGNNTNNGSTSHEMAKIIRLNCEYFGNIGPNVADVDTGTRSFNYGVVSHDSAGSSTNKSGFQCQSGIMWNDTCSAYNNDYNFQSYLGGELRQHNCSGSVNLIGNGKATAY